MYNLQMFIQESSFAHYLHKCLMCRMLQIKKKEVFLGFSFDFWAKQLYFICIQCTFCITKKGVKILCKLQ